MSKTCFLWDPIEDNIVKELDGGRATVAEYTTEPSLYGDIVSQNRGGVESQFHYEAQGSTLAVTDDNQNDTDTFAYTAFAEVTERTGTTEILFQYIGRNGYYTDSVTGQIIVRRRPYDSARARWLAADPLTGTGERSQLNAYVANSGLNAVDPSGLRSDRELEYSNVAEQQPTGSDYFQSGCTCESCSDDEPKPKPECDTAKSKTAVRKDSMGNVTCAQIVPGVMLKLKTDTEVINGTPKFVDVCYGCIDHRCASGAPKGKTHECFLDKVVEAKSVTHKCRCIKER
jgi:RHS repeat-associated protein